MKPIPPKNRSVKGTPPAQTHGPVVVVVIVVGLLCFIAVAALGVSQPQSNSECRSHG